MSGGRGVLGLAPCSPGSVPRFAPEEAGRSSGTAPGELRGGASPPPRCPSGKGCSDSRRGAKPARGAAESRATGPVCRIQAPGLRAPAMGP